MPFSTRDNQPKSEPLAAQHRSADQMRLQSASTYVNSRCGQLAINPAEYGQLMVTRCLDGLREKIGSESLRSTHFLLLVSTDYADSHLLQQLRLGITRESRRQLRRRLPLIISYRDRVFGNHLRVSGAILTCVGIASRSWENTAQDTGELQPGNPS